MIKAILVMTHDGTGDWQTPDHVISTSEMTFADSNELHSWMSKQNQHPWYTLHIKSQVEIKE